ncbi:TonB-dependent receptor plug domain protein [Flavobacterium sp. 9R]|uniref:TonB-dependent receptor n=1 Tax=Flavobacterium sp. 9R TaxID=2653143 RepID=UPI0012EF2930|nr:carboxypeptidase-like regulatory domain-containing protein [Flavobacterium sp. 9R]VXB54508.1 TonB-dependent receptor plug domain protein [Flavobacterium sp. 9R]
MFSQKGKLQGFILDDKKNPVNDVNITIQGLTSQTNAKGFYSIAIPSNEKVAVVFSHISFKKATLILMVTPNEVVDFNLVLSEKEEQMGEVFVNANNKKSVQGILTIEPATLKNIPGANPGIENVLKSLAGVNSNNELSSQYAVRGGNYDENLVYVNEVEVYRPFLIRSGQQEGLSFTNTDLIQNVDFSAGGFQSKYGDKLSSVLDITYRKPTQFGATVEASFLGGSASLDLVSKDKRWTAITGVRYRNNSLLVNSQETQTNYTPSFVDVQTAINFQASSKWQWSFLGNISQNKYNYEPLTRQTNFGTIDNPQALLIFYEGQERDQYQTFFGAIKTTFKASDVSTYKFVGAVFHTLEKEHFDILAEYRLAEIDTNIGSETLGDVSFSRGIGSQLNHARNDLDALIANAEFKGIHDWKNNLVEWGVKYTRESIRDRISEWEVIDSAGFTLNPPRFLPKKDEPYTIYNGPLAPYQDVRAINFNTINRFSGYLQWSRKANLGTSLVWYNLGVRMHSWQVLGGAVSDDQQFTFSPRAQFTIKPNTKANLLFRLSGGMYHQPPSYRELRDSEGVVQPNVKAQQSVHLVLGNDYSFNLWSRPFKLVTELYYKSLSDVNTYTIDNVRIRYQANNDAKAYAQGIDVRWNGEFVPGTESWISFGYLKTEENSNGKGFIARPTDQRLKFAMLFQDYMPNIPSVKLYLNLVYNTGLPGGSPSYADPYLYQSRLRDYRRADVGFSKLLVDRSNSRQYGKWANSFQELAIGVEVFNIFNNQNAITNTWVRDVYTKNQYGIPNYMTTRVFNIKLNARF